MFSLRSNGLPRRGDLALLGSRSVVHINRQVRGALYAARLLAAGVDLVPETQLDGAKLSGMSYRLDGVTMKGSDLGRLYSPAGLAKYGVVYDKERDFETASRCIESGAREHVGRADRSTAARADGQCRVTSIDALAEAMASLAEEARRSLAQIESQGMQQVEKFIAQLGAAEKAFAESVARAQQAAEDMESAARWINLRQLLLTIATGAVSGLLVSAFWLWLAPAIT